MPDTPAEYPADLADLFHRHAICERDIRIRVTALGDDYFGDLHVGQVVEAIVVDDECAALTGGRALVRSHHDNWELAA